MVRFQLRKAYNQLLDGQVGARIDPLRVNSVSGKYVLAVVEQAPGPDAPMQVPVSLNMSKTPHAYAILSAAQRVDGVRKAQCTRAGPSSGRFRPCTQLLMSMCPKAWRILDGCTAMWRGGLL